MFGRAVYEDANNATAPLANREAGQEPFARSEDAFRFGKLQQQQRGPNYNGSSKYAVFSFGIPTHVSPASVAAHFPNTASHFPSSQLINTKVPIDREEATRFDVLRARRAAIAPYDNARQEAANFRRMDYVRRDIMNQQRAELKRHEKINAARERKGHPESVNNFNIPTHVSLATVASHFPYAASHFPRGGQSKVPIAFEQAHRFDGLAARREALANRERERFDGAAERREAILVHRQSILEDKDRMRQEGVERAKARRAKLFADAMVAQKQMQGQQIPQTKQTTAALQRNIQNDTAVGITNVKDVKEHGTWSNVKDKNSTYVIVDDKVSAPVAVAEKPLTKNATVLASNAPTTVNKDLPMETTDDKQQQQLMFFALPETIVMADIERHFPHAATAMHKFESSHHKDKFLQKNFKQSIPRKEEEAHRFGLVPIRRSAIANHDKQRQKENVSRGLAFLENRRSSAENMSLRRSRRAHAKENVGLAVGAAEAGITNVKDVKEHGTWSNVKDKNSTYVIVDDKVSAPVAEKPMKEQQPLPLVAAKPNTLKNENEAQKPLTQEPTQAPVVLASNAPTTVNKDLPMETTDDKQQQQLMFFALPETIVMADIERHFPHAAGSMHQFESTNDKETYLKKNFKQSIPRKEEEAHRFDLVPIRRSTIALRDKQRQNESVSRALATVETRRFVAKNESLMRARRIHNRDNAGWVEAIGVTTTEVKDVKEHGTWSNVNDKNVTTVIVDDKVGASARVASNAYTTEETGKDAIIHQQQVPAASSAPSVAENQNKTIVHATKDEAGKPLVDEADVIAASKASPNKEIVVVSDSKNPSDSSNNANHHVPVHQSLADSKIKPKKFCC